MTYRGHIQNGAVVFDQPIELPEGTPVEVQPLGPETSQPDGKSSPNPLDELKDFIGMCASLPEDASVNHDHYLYGTPKVVD